jgi:hypothetical protein
VGFDIADQLMTRFSAFVRCWRKKNGSTILLIDASKEIGLEVNAEKTKHKLLAHHQNACQNCDIKIANRSFENVSQFKCLGMT